MINILLYQILVYIIHGKIFTKHIITRNLKYQPQNWNETFELPDGSYSLSDIEKYISSISLKTWNSNWVRIYVKKIGKRITFKIKIYYYLELLTPETMKLLRVTKGKINMSKKKSFV